MGTSRRLKEFNTAISCISLQPEDAFHGLEGLKHMPTAIIPGIYDPGVADRNLAGPTGAAYDLARRLAREEGLLSGISCGAAAAVAIRLAQEEEFAGKTIVVILPDSGERYLSTVLFEGLAQ